MTRAQLEHVIRAAATIANQRALVVVGSQAILASHPRPPRELVESMEVDLYPLDDPGLAELIDGTIGEGSPFHETFGYYAHGVGPETATLPADWLQRAVVVTGPGTAGAEAFCPCTEDVLLSKLAAGRDKDLDFVRVALEAGVTTPDALRARAADFGPERSAVLIDRVRRLTSAAGR